MTILKFITGPGSVHTAVSFATDYGLVKGGEQVIYVAAAGGDGWGLVGAEDGVGAVGAWAGGARRFS